VGRDSPRARERFRAPDGGAIRRAASSRRELALLAKLVDAFDAPAWVLDAKSRVVHASVGARRSRQDPPSAKESNDGGLRVIPITLDGEACRVVIASPKTLAASDATRNELPPSLQRIAELVVRGLSNRDIAEQTGRSLATVRVYVARIYRHLGVRGRVDLARAARLSDARTSTAPPSDDEQTTP
jgi:DNA-binding CsgD family transcriptional regulator